MSRRSNSFILWLGITFAAALIFPSFGAVLSEYASVQIILIMILYFGMGLSTEFSVLVRGARNYRLHLITQMCIFVVAPIVAFAFYSLVSLVTPPSIAVGILFLGCLPTTITSCIMLTSHSKGNAVGAMYNAMLSQILAVFIAPMILSLLIGTRIEQTASLGSIILSLLQRMLLPLLAGQLIRILLPALVRRLGFFPERISFNVIFIILYISMSSVMINDLLLANIPYLIVPALAACVMCVVLLYFSWWVGGFASFPIADRISIAYTGTQKTIAMGIPLAAIYFAGNYELISYTSLVIVAYYTFSLFFSAITVDRIVAKARIHHA